MSTFNDYANILESVKHVTCECVLGQIGSYRSIAVGSYPYNVALVTIGNDGVATAVHTRYDVYTHASNPGDVSHQVNNYSNRGTAFYVDAHQIDAVPGTDEQLVAAL